MQQAQPEKGPPAQGASSSSHSNKQQPLQPNAATSAQLHAPFYSITPTAHIPLPELPEKLLPDTGNASTAASSGETVRTHSENNGEDNSRPNNNSIHHTLEPATFGTVAAIVTVSALELYASSTTTHADIVTALQAFCEKIVRQVPSIPAATRRTQYFSADTQHREQSLTPEQREEGPPATVKKKEESQQPS